jgi:hypothetical protein
MLELLRRLLELGALGLAIAVTVLVFASAGPLQLRWDLTVVALLAVAADAALRPGRPA